MYDDKENIPQNKTEFKIHVLHRAMKSVLPKYALIAKDAKFRIDEALVTFIQRVTSEAVAVAHNNNRTKITEKDVVEAMEQMGMDKYAGYSKLFLQRCASGNDDGTGSENPLNKDLPQSEILEEGHMMRDQNISDAVPLPNVIERNSSILRTRDQVVLGSSPKVYPSLAHQTMWRQPTEAFENRFTNSSRGRNVASTVQNAGMSSEDLVMNENLVTLALQNSNDGRFASSCTSGFIGGIVPPVTSLTSPPCSSSFLPPSPTRNLPNSTQVLPVTVPTITDYERNEERNDSMQDDHSFLSSSPDPFSADAVSAAFETVPWTLPNSPLFSDFIPSTYVSPVTDLINGVEGFDEMMEPLQEEREENSMSHNTPSVLQEGTCTPHSEAIELLSLHSDEVSASDQGSNQHATDLGQWLNVDRDTNSLSESLSEFSFLGE